MDSDARTFARPITCSPCEVWEDPIIAELDAYREQQAARFDYDVAKLLEEAAARESVPIREQIASWGIQPSTDSVLLPSGNTPTEDPILAELDADQERHVSPLP